MYTCAIVDNDELYIELLSTYLKKTKLFHQPIILKNGEDAIKVLKMNIVDLVFLDYNISKLTEHNLSVSLKQRSAIIMVSVSRENAAESFDIGGILDYLIKPYEFARFLLAIQCGISYLEGCITNCISKKTNIQQREYINLKTARSHTRFKISEILYAKAYSPYLKIYTNDSCTVVNERLGNLLAKLPLEHFTRVHKAYIININHIVKIDPNNIHISSNKIPIGIKFKPLVKQLLTNIYGYEKSYSVNWQDLGRRELEKPLSVITADSFSVN